MGWMWYKNNDTNAEPGLKFIYSSNIKIQNCSFHHSVGQAIVLSEVSGYLNITHSEFINNIHYRGHGAAIHCSLNNVINSSKLLFGDGDSSVYSSLFLGDIQLKR